MDLAPWNERLLQHFATLSETRGSGGGDRPVFALEHGLNRDELADLGTAICSHIRQAAPSRDHALAWIVYAAEIGYRYSGDEYWQTFENETPGWTEHGDRYWIRDRFRWFKNKFGGAEPSGAWAEQFSIICWPITHAILPQDLQEQLARTLYEIRYSFSEEMLKAPAILGEFVAAHSWNSTSRFQTFAQETSLVGQIAAALLLQDEPGTAALIYPPTLRRIREDLDRHRRGREWLRDARRSAQKRATIRGLSTDHRRETEFTQPADARAEVVKLGIEPRVVLRPLETDGMSWQVLLEIPDLSHLLVRFPQARDILSGARCVVAGAAGRPLARGRCLHGPQRVVLERWPQADEVLLQFERPDPQLDYLLRTECLLRPSDKWLFRVASDGLAYELRDLRARAGNRYILVSRAGAVHAGTLTRYTALTCKGVRASLLALPDSLSAEWEAALIKLGLSLTRTIEVWPAGLAAAVWDGEGYGEWLASERPCIAIQCDHAVDALLLSLRPGGTALELNDVAPGKPLFVELPTLPIGLHSVQIAARPVKGTGMEPLGELDVVVRVREARPWGPGVSAEGPLAVYVEPPSPTLEQLWEGSLEINVRGPQAHHIKCAVSMFNRSNDPPTLTRDLPPVSLPLTTDDWRRHFEKHFRQKKEVWNSFDSAHSCTLKFSADEAGEFTLVCERQFVPLRWGLRLVGKQYIVRAFEDVGSGKTPDLCRMAFEAPSERVPLQPPMEYQAPAAGGLYVAQMDKFVASIVVPPVVQELADLRCQPTFRDRERSAKGVLGLLRLGVLWSSARLTGDILSAVRQRAVLRALASHVSRIIGGDTWGEAEAKAEGGRDAGLVGLRRAISKNRDSAEIGPVLATECPILVKKSMAERIERFAALAGLFLGARSNELPWVAELSLRIASHPASVEPWARERLETGLSRLLELPTLVRAARFLVIQVDRHLDSVTTAGELYAGWRWE